MVFTLAEADLGAGVEVGVGMGMLVVVIVVAMVIVMKVLRLFEVSATGELRFEFESEDLRGRWLTTTVFVGTYSSIYAVDGRYPSGVDVYDSRVRLSRKSTTRARTSK